MTSHDFTSEKVIPSIRIWNDSMYGEKTAQKSKVTFFDSESNVSPKSNHTRATSVRSKGRKTARSSCRKYSLHISKFKNIIGGDEEIDDSLLEKMDYFYKPYEKKTDAGAPICIKFDQASPVKKSKVRNFSETSKDNWKSISAKVLKSTTSDFKNLIKAVNGRFYYKIRKESQLLKQSQGKREAGLGLNLFRRAVISRLTNAGKLRGNRSKGGESRLFNPRRSLFTPVLSPKKCQNLKIPNEVPCPLNKSMTPMNLFSTPRPRTSYLSSSQASQRKCSKFKNSQNPQNSKGGLTKMPKTQCKFRKISNLKHSYTPSQKFTVAKLALATLAN